jgi:hypothetical protein
LKQDVKIVVKPREASANDLKMEYFAKEGADDEVLIGGGGDQEANT